MPALESQLVECFFAQSILAFKQDPNWLTWTSTKGDRQVGHPCKAKWKNRVCCSTVTIPAGFSNFNGALGDLAQGWATEETVLLGLETTDI